MQKLIARRRVLGIDDEEGNEMAVEDGSASDSEAEAKKGVWCCAHGCVA